MEYLEIESIIGLISLSVNIISSGQSSLSTIQ